jgi:UDP-glucuronate 4-epimerase
MKGQPITLFGDGSTARDYTFVTDIVSGIRQAQLKLFQSKPGFCDTYNLGGNRTTSLLELVGLIEKHLKVKAEKRWDGMQPGDVTLTSANIEKSAREIGYSPLVEIDTGIGHAVAWHQNGTDDSARKNF